MEPSLPSCVKKSLTDCEGRVNKEFMDESAAREYTLKLIVGFDKTTRDNLYLPLTTVASKRKPPKPGKPSLLTAGLTCREKRRSQLNKQSYLEPDLVRKMRSMWLEYFSSCLPSVDIQKSKETVSRVDFIGCPIKIVRSKISNQIGLSGVIVQDNVNSFRFANESTGKIKTIAKNGTDVEVDHVINGHKIVIFMSQMTFRPSDRATRKFRTYSKPDVSFEALLEMWDSQHEGS